MATEDRTTYRVRESFSFDFEGRPYVMAKGDVIDANHPAMSRRSLLEPVTPENVKEDTAERTVTATQATETTSATPGTRRPAPGREKS